MEHAVILLACASAFAFGIGCLCRPELYRKVAWLPAYRRRRLAERPVWSHWFGRFFGAGAVLVGGAGPSPPLLC